jgi:hypothetical protein
MQVPTRIRCANVRLRTGVDNTVQGASSSRTQINSKCQSDTLWNLAARSSHPGFHTPSKVMPREK